MTYEQTTAPEARPVTDWVNDWDWLDPSWGSRAIEIWNDVREPGCPMAFTERYGRAWMPITMDAVTQVAHDTTHFSSQWVSVSQPDSPRRPAPPITSDPPDHHGHRRLLLPSFGPKADRRDGGRHARLLPVAARRARRVATAPTPPRTTAQHLPVHAISQMVGVPETDADAVPRLDLPQLPARPARQRRRKLRLSEEMATYFDELLDARRAEPARRPGDARHAGRDRRPAGTAASCSAGISCC